MKKFIAAGLAASLTFAAAGVFPASAAENGKNLVILGDSIAAGYGLSADEKNYGELLKDYYGKDSVLANFAVSGSTSQDWVNALETPKAELTAALSDADVVVISVGGNDLLQYASKFLLDFAVTNNLLSDGYTADSIPANPGISDLMNIMDRDKAADFVGSASNALILLNTTARLTAHLRMINSTKYDCLIQTQVIPNIDKIVTDIRAVNSDPDLKIVVQNLYDPIQFEASYAASMSANRKKLLEQLGSVCRDVVAVDPSSDNAKSFATQLKDYAAENNVIVADVYTDFTSADSAGNKNAWYFTGIQKPDKEMDIHPNQAGHLAIAAVIEKALGDLTNHGTLMQSTYEGLSDPASYPAVAYQTYLDVIANTVVDPDPRKEDFMLGDVDGDKIIDATDASAILADYALTQIKAPSEFTEDQAKAADIDGDTKIDATDASAVLSYYAYTKTGGKNSLPEFLVDFLKA